MHVCLLTRTMFGRHLLVWKVYEAVITIHWFKVVKRYGVWDRQALLSLVMRDLQSRITQSFLHTQPGSYRAIKAYSDFGFALLPIRFIGTERTISRRACRFWKA